MQTFENGKFWSTRRYYVYSHMKKYAYMFGETENDIKDEYENHYGPLPEDLPDYYKTLEKCAAEHSETVEIEDLLNDKEWKGIKYAIGLDYTKTILDEINLDYYCKMGSFIKIEDFRAYLGKKFVDKTDNNVMKGDMFRYMDILEFAEYLVDRYGDDYIVWKEAAEKESKNIVFDETPTVEEFIEYLKRFNPKAKVKMHFTAWVDDNNGIKEAKDGRRYIIGNNGCDGVTGHPFVGDDSFNDNEVWVYSKGLI